MFGDGAARVRGKSSRYDPRVVIHQPISCPGWYFQRLRRRIVHRSDHVQFTAPAGAGHPRDIKDFTGREMLSCGCRRHVGTAIRDISGADPDWRKESLNLLRENYARQPISINIPPTRAPYALPHRACGNEPAALDLLEELLDVRGRA